MAQIESCDDDAVHVEKSSEFYTDNLAVWERYDGKISIEAGTEFSNIDLKLKKDMAERLIKELIRVIYKLDSIEELFGVKNEPKRKG